MSELRAAAERVRLDGGPRQRWGATAGGLAIVIGLSILDASWSKDFPTAVVIGPFFTALAASERQTAAVAIAAVASVLLSAIWNDTGLEAAYWLRATVVATGGALAVVAAPPAHARHAGRGDRRAAHRRALQPGRGRGRAGRQPPPAVRERRGGQDARLRVRRGAADHPAGAARRRGRLLQRGRLAAERPRVPHRTRAPRREPGTGDDPHRQAPHGRGALAGHQGARRQRQPRTPAAGGQRHRGHHRSEALRARAAAALPHRRRARVLARLRADAQGGRRPRRARARRLVRGQHARPPGLHPAGRRRPQRPVESRVRARLRRAATRRTRAMRPAPRRSSATGRPS